MAQQISLLLPHLGGEAHSLRCGIVSAVGCLLHKGFESAPGEAADAQGEPVSCAITSMQFLKFLHDCMGHSGLDKLAFPVLLDYDAPMLVHSPNPHI
jgi:hypothetical protein